jgi:HK97 gp10 family phage protein
MFRITGVREAMVMIMSAANNHPKKIKQQTAISARAIANSAKKKVPIDTGDLKRSIAVDLQGFTGTISANEDYAPFIEFGTGAGVDVPNGFEPLAIQFKGKKRKTNRKAQPFLVPAFLEEIPKYKEACQRIIQNK